MSALLGRDVVILGQRKNKIEVRQRDATTEPDTKKRC